ncbi:YraN family protein [Peptacetobacter sp.]|uniref:YraN family protein n=1 Tax=Peptacetobacter sp. TaxID=2991975 RepID=UPI00262E3403|nr:YraN family protein [Peptacetobacter sp.]
MNNVEKGRIGENIALKFLIDKGATILERNYWSKFGEIDIIAYFDATEIVFIEVKSRTNCKYGYPAEAVDINKQNKIRKTAEYYIMSNFIEDVSVRFDVIEIYIKDRKIKHIINAF